MELTLLLMADYANVTADNKLNVMGIFGNLNARKFPVTHPLMYLIVRLTAGAAEYGREIRLGVKLINEDATQELVNLETKARVPRGRAGEEVNVNQIIFLRNLKFPEAGFYEFSVLVDHDVKGSVPLEVRQVAERKKPPPPEEEPPDAVV